MECKIHYTISVKISMCFFKYVYDNFPYNSVKANDKWHTKMIIRHSLLKRDFKCIVSLLQLNYMDI